MALCSAGLRHSDAAGQTVPPQQPRQPVALHAQHPGRRGLVARGRPQGTLEQTPFRLRECHNRPPHRGPPLPVAPSRTKPGRSFSAIWQPVEKTSACSIAFCSSRTLPGHS